MHLFQHVKIDRDYFPSRVHRGRVCKLSVQLIELCWHRRNTAERYATRVRGGECAVNVHAVAIECRRLSPAVKRPAVNTRPVKRRQSFARQSVVLLNSNLGNLSRPWMLHLAAEIDNRSPRRRLHHRNLIQISG